MRTIAKRLSELPARRPLAMLALVAALAVAGGILALGLRPSAATDAFVSASSPAYRATVQEQRHFGSDAVAVLVRAPLAKLLRPAALHSLTELEACLAGQSVSRSATLQADVPAPAGSHAPYGGPSSPCGALMRHHPALVVYGPGTFLNRAVAAINGSLRGALAGVRAAGDRAAATAERLARARGLGRQAVLADGAAAREAEEIAQLQALERAAGGTGLDALPSITNEAFIRRVVFGPRGATPRSRVRYLFPGADAALIQVRLRASLSAAEQTRAIRWIREAVRMPRFRLPAGGSYVVSGVPVVVADLAGQITGAIGVLLIVAVGVMALVLTLLFGRPPRLLPLAVALAATGITFGALALLGVALTLASVAVLPVLLGLAVDYGVQLQSRADQDGVRPALPAIATAALATAAGVAVLELSPVPMVRGFGIVLVAGIAVALGCTLAVVPAALSLRRSGGGLVGASLRGAGELLAPLGALAGRARSAALASLRGAGEILRVPSRRDRTRGTIGALARHPVRVLAVGVVLAVGGWVADSHTPVQSDITKLVPQSTPAIHDLHTLEAATGVSGEIDVAVRARDVATPAVVAWMSRYESELLRRFGGSDCAHATLCPALSLPDLFSTTGGSGAVGSTPTRPQIDALLDAVPAYFSSAVITRDRREATLAFGIRLMPLSRQQRVVAAMRARLHPPPGVRAALTGVPVLAAEADAALASPGRRLLTVLAGLVAVALVLLVVFRHPGRALAPMIPIVLATGWSALVLYALGIPLNPMSATLGALVIAISTEFSVLLSERVRQERAAGAPAAAALAGAYRSTGSAVLVSGVTAVAGFGVLVVSDIAMLRDFGLVTLVDLTVSLGGVLLVLPAALALASPAREGRGARRRPVLRRRRGRARVAAGRLTPPTFRRGRMPSGGE
ncbi:MAG TPA: MMPL family transporter [Solirubrobacteraceae bacterium]|nr:MMPL family transporter [Solirubrobacteraceae bacterium]